MDKGQPVIRPGIAAWLSAITLAAALVIGVALIRSLGEAAEAVRRGGEAASAAHDSTAGLEAWGNASTEPLRDSVRASLTVRFRELRADLTDPAAIGLIDDVIAGLKASDVDFSTRARGGMVAFLARQDEALFAAAEAAQRAQRYALVLLALAALGAGVLVVPLAWLWVRQKEGQATS